MAAASAEQAEGRVAHAYKALAGAGVEVPEDDREPAGAGAR